jgi:hypothetical protein
MSHSSKRKLFKGFFIGLILGALVVFGLRFSLIKNDHVHYHANFALYINGERDEFKAFTFYEEVAACEADHANNPKARTHMHDQVNNIAHVHDNGATWGNFFENLGYTLGDNLIKTDQGVFIDGAEGKKLTFIVNGQKVPTLANRVIQSEDAVLISYGNDDETVLQIQQMSVTKNAHEFNLKADPAACSGQKFDVKSRLQKAFSLTK